MANDYFSFKGFTIRQGACAMKVTTDGCLFGAWVADGIAKGDWKKANALDLGTGTGLLSLMVAQKVTLSIDAIEINAAAAKQAAENIESSEQSEITVIHGDVLKLKLSQYDLIFSNPPFYETELASPDADRSLAHHNEGLLWKDLFGLLAAQLRIHGAFFLLLPTKRFSEAQTLLQKAGLYIYQAHYVKQTPKHAPFRVMIRGGKIAGNASTTEMTIRDEKGVYSAAFIDLLRDYYLYL